MYDSNPTLENIKDIDESKQGDVFFKDRMMGEFNPEGRKFYIESYGCAMNFSDSEIVASILGEIGFSPTRNMEESDLILVNTCSIREKAEETVRKRLHIFAKAKKANPGMKIGILGCMAERLKKQWLEEEKIVDLVVGPDAYRDLPKLIDGVDEGNRMVNVLLSKEETYADLTPMRLITNGVSAFISIMRGCDNMCSFCVVPFTRGRERSREPMSILAEARDLFERGYREVTLLGQNVDSYKWKNPEDGTHFSFANLLEMVAHIHPDLRVRFSTSHPKDLTDDVIFTIAKYENVCKYIHLPVQSGNSRILDLMNRTYTREWYEERIRMIYATIPECAVSSDIITGFCSETEEEHQDTLSIIENSKFFMSYMYFYSERPGTLAARKYADDIPEDVKKRRLQEVIRMQNAVSFRHNSLDVGKTFKVLIDGDSKKSEHDFCGRNTQNKTMVFPKIDGFKPGMYVNVKVREVSVATLLGDIVVG
jgi:tRNA-2-methylthio-N6-dimethylallyladenosine synthase